MSKATGTLNSNKIDVACVGTPLLLEMSSITVSLLYHLISWFTCLHLRVHAISELR